MPAEQSAGQRRKKSRGAFAPKTLYLVLGKHLWKYNECKCPHLSRPRCKTVLWLAVVGAEQSGADDCLFCSLPDSNWSPKFSPPENSGNEFFRSQLVAFELMLT